MESYQVSDCAWNGMGQVLGGGRVHVSHPTVSTLLIIFCSEGRDRLWLRHHAWDEVVDMDVQVQ